MTRKITIIGLITATAVLVAWDIYVATNATTGDTISEVVLDFALSSPIVGVAIGFVLGHLLWPQWRKRDLELKTKLTELESQRDAMEAEIASLRLGVATLQADYASLQDTYDKTLQERDEAQHEFDAEKWGNKVAELETEISQLETQTKQLVKGTVAAEERANDALNKMMQERDTVQQQRDQYRRWWESRDKQYDIDREHWKSAFEAMKQNNEKLLRYVPPCTGTGCDTHVHKDDCAASKPYDELFEDNKNLRRELNRLRGILLTKC